MTETKAPERVSDRLKRLSDAATPMNLASAEIYEEDEEIQCPLCHTNGYVEANTYVNIDGVALNVQFSGIGDEFGANQEFVLALIEAYRSGDLIPADHSSALVAAAYEAAANACDDYPRAAPDEDEWTRYDEQIEYSQLVIRALTPDDAQSALDAALAQAREEGRIAGLREAASDNDLYYLRAIKRRLDEFQSCFDEVEAHIPSLGSEAFADERDWLDCFLSSIPAGVEKEAGE